MKIVFILWFLLMSCCSTSKKTEAPVAVSTVAQYDYQDMDKDTAKTFKKQNPTSNPGKVCGHFRDVKQIECAQLTLNKGEGVIKLTLQTKDALLTVYEIKPQTDIVYLLLKKPGKIKDFNGKVFEKIHQLDSVELVFDEKSSVRFYWKNGKFNEVWTSD